MRKIFTISLLVSINFALGYGVCRWQVIALNAATSNGGMSEMISDIAPINSETTPEDRISTIREIGEDDLAKTAMFALALSASRDESASVREEALDAFVYRLDSEIRGSLKILEEQWISIDSGGVLEERRRSVSDGLRQYLNSREER